MSDHDEATLAKINALLHQAVAEHRAGRLGEAETLYLEALNIEPRIPDAQHFYGALLLQSGRHELALRPLKKAIELNASQPAFHNNLGLALKSLGQVHAAVEAFEAALKLAPDNYDANLNLGVVLQKMGSLDTAMTHYQNAIEIDPDNPAAYKNLGTAFKQQGLTKQAIEVYSKALALQADDVDVLINLGNAFYAQNDCDNALQAYQRALQLDPGDAEVLLCIGNALRDTGRNVEAKAAYQSAIDIAPHNDGAYFELGCIFQQEENKQEAIKYYRSAIDQDPQQLDAMNNLGIIYMEQELFDNAISLFRRATDIDETHIEAWNNLGNALQKTGHYDEAIQVYEHVLLLDPGSGTPVDDSGDSSHDSGNWQTGDTWSHSCHQLVSLLNAKGEKDRATEITKKWLEIDPENPVPRHLLAAQTGKQVPARASNDYIREEFDRFAQTFDDNLKGLDYRAPDLIALQLHSLVARRDLDILDAGCGTGLCGPLVRDRARRLVGVDLSKGMLEKARVRGCYDELVENELVAYLESGTSKFDVLLSADTLNYFGNLTEVFRSARSVLQDNGWFLFTLEVARAEPGPSGFTLNSHGRYSHSESYIQDKLAQAGFAIHSMAMSTLRKEANEDVAGWIIVAQPVS